MRLNLNLIRFFGICLLIKVFCASLFAKDHHNSTIHIVYTANLNCSLDDCRCSGNIVGGLTRIITVVDSLRAKFPNLILLDGGDHLSSYSLPEANRVMLSLLSRLHYTALNLGDQEFVESENFVFEVSGENKLRLPYISSNLFGENSSELLADPFKVVSKTETPVRILGCIDPGVFEFISPRHLTIKSPGALLDQQTPANTGGSELQILLFHGKLQKARELVKRNPWIDIVVLSHNQELRFDVEEKTAFVESGTEGEYIGHLQINRNGDSWEFQNEFIPIYDRIPPNREAQRRVDEYYRKMHRARNQGTTSQDSE